MSMGCGLRGVCVCQRTAQNKAEEIHQSSQQIENNRIRDDDDSAKEGMRTAFLTQNGTNPGGIEKGWLWVQARGLHAPHTLISPTLAHIWCDTFLLKVDPFFSTKNLPCPSQTPL